MYAAALAPAAQRRLRVRQAVVQLMSEHGFRFSMDAVAERVGCSKQTLYSQFGSKQALMRSAMLEELALATVRLDVDANDLRAGLLGFATDQLERLSDPTLVAACKLVNAEAHLYPEEARSLFTDACEKLLERLAAWLQAAMRRGQLRHDDPHMAAELLLSMISGLDFERQRFNLPYRDSDASRRQWAEFVVDAFLRAFAPAATHARDAVPSHRFRQA
ncbi:TetR/AcrR family transcriptional regulator [Pseudoxanthomonas helianthi]|uniref:TetR/AcrR family transcriptional regulator n=1 Tax=Pseudoxanthomonas helianthi TaxID=1453541 RepID=A0A940X6L2_9GAMM|nr:TetR/AcrR family transcriptional regulator [Pseudoxanthomonas helianthi]MBP3985219.1 TetR/AcrR family transcriptional regulator [Pseudoxanthomonas helianthi]